MATVFSPLWPSILTVTLPAFSSTLSTVAAADAPLIATLTLSPALSDDVADGLTSGVGAEVAGEACSSVGAGLLLVFVLVFAFELLSVEPESQAANATDKSTTAKIFLIMLASLVPAALYRAAFQLSSVNGMGRQNISNCREKLSI